MKNGPVLQFFSTSHPKLDLAFLVTSCCRRSRPILQESYKLGKHPEYKTSFVLLKANIQTLGQLKKINELSVSEFKWKSSCFLGCVC